MQPMTDFLALQVSAPFRARSGWRRRKAAQKWQSLISVFLTVILVFAVISGMGKGFSLKNYLGTSSWSADAPFAAVVGTKPVSVLVVPPDVKKAVFLTLAPDTYVPTGREEEPLSKLADLPVQGPELARVMSLSYGAKIANFVILKDEVLAREESLLKLFKEFVSPATPFLILTGKYKEKLSQTNITQTDLFRLWWQVKGLSVDQVNLVDMSLYREPVITKSAQVLGVDEVSLNKKIAAYVASPKIADSGYKVSIENFSGSRYGGYLVEQFVTSAGLSVTSIGHEEEVIGKTLVVGRGQVADFLAKMFECDIFDEPSMAENTVIVRVGSDFTARYFE